MIPSSRRSALSPPVARRFEFTRLQNQLIALAYQVLIPVVSRHTDRPQPRPSRNPTTTVQTFQSRAGGV